MESGSFVESNVSKRQFWIAIVTYSTTLSPYFIFGLPTLMLSSTNLSKDQISWVASASSISTPIGCILAGTICDKLGRKGALMTINADLVISWLFIAVAYYTLRLQFVLLFIGMFVGGLSIGMTMVAPSIYTSEVSRPTLRLMLNMWGGIMYSFSIFIVSLLGLFLKGNWGIIAIIALLFTFDITFCVVLFLPESPVWLLSNNDIEKAKINFQKVFKYQIEDVTLKEELDALLASNVASSELLNSTPLIKRLLKSKCIKSMIIICACYFFLNFSGTFVLVAYCTDILKKFKVTFDVYWCLCFISAIRCVCSLCFTYLGKRYSHRQLLLLSTISTCVVMIGLGIYLSCLIHFNLSYKVLEDLSWIPVLLFSAATLTIGFIILPGIIGSEIFPQDVRGVAAGVAAFIGSMFNFVAIKSYQGLVYNLGASLLFFIYGTFALIGSIFIYIFLPDIKGKTLREIENEC